MLVAPFERFVMRGMHILLHEPAAIYQLACQQPDKSTVFKRWKTQISPGRCVLWQHKPEAEDPLLLTIQCDGAVTGFGQIDGSRFVVGTGKKVEVCDGPNGELIEAFEGGSQVLSVAVGKAYFCAGYEDGTIKIWNSGER